MGHSLDEIFFPLGLLSWSRCLPRFLRGKGRRKVQHAKEHLVTVGLRESTQMVPSLVSELLPQSIMGCMK